MIERKKKKCEGRNKALGFEGCGEYFFLYKYGLCLECFKEWAYTTGEGAEFRQKNRLNTSDPIKRNAKLKAKSDNVLPKLKQEAVGVFHGYIKLRDQGKPCVSCGAPYRADFQATHCFKAESYSSLKYHELNVHGGCETCNIHKDGNFKEYLKRLPGRIGPEQFQELLQLAGKDKKQDFKWERAALEEIISTYKQKTKELKTKAEY